MRVVRTLLGVLGQPDRKIAADDIERLPMIWEALAADYAELSRAQRAGGAVGQAALAALRENVAYQTQLRNLDGVFAEAWDRVRAQGNFRGLGCSRDGLGLAPLVAVAIVAAGAIVAVASVVALSVYLTNRASATAAGNAYVNAYAQYVEAKRTNPNVQPPAAPTYPSAGNVRVGDFGIGSLVLLAGAAWLFFAGGKRRA